jgi:hypothetical protein
MQLGGAGVIVFSGDPFINIVYEQYNKSNPIINAIFDFQWSRV